MLDRRSNGLLVCVAAIMVGCGGATGLPMMDESVGGAGQNASSGNSGTSAAGGYPTTYPSPTTVVSTTSAQGGSSTGYPTSTAVGTTTKATGGYPTTYSAPSGGFTMTNATGGTWSVTATTSVGATGGTTSGVVWDGAQCATVTPCGGDIRGTWVIDSECTQGAVVYANAELGTLYAGCDHVMSAFGVMAAGTVEYTETVEIAKTTSTVTTRSFYSSTCMASISGLSSVTPTAELCDQIANYLVSTQDSASGNCGAASIGCKCEISTENSRYSETAYATRDYRIVYPDDGSTMGYCVQGNRLTLMAAPPDAPYTLVVTMHRN